MFLLIFIVTAAISIIAVCRVKAAYAKWSKVPAGSGYTGARCAERILESAGIHDVEIVEADSMLGDHYDPMNKRLVLSTENYHGDSAAALGVSAHECGHAIQHKLAYAPLQWRMASVGATTYANQAVTWLPLLFWITGGYHGGFGISLHTYLLVMSLGWGIIMLFNLITLPVEFDASRRAKIILNKMHFLSSEEAETGMRKVLDAAAWTYVAAFITSLLYMLYYLLPLLMGGRRND
ncbi:MAG: zinc metallopeptidase [Methylacidiphilales bacterium]|nr:zinc metallopeptidase [Candidatus Methylacidiphilales bacterium]